MRHFSLSRLNNILIFWFLLGLILYLGKTFLVPLFFAILLGMLLLPICNALEKKGISRIMSTFLGLLLILLIIIAIGYVLVAQGNNVMLSWPQMQVKIQQLITEFRIHLQDHLGIGFKQQSDFLTNRLGRISEVLGEWFGNFLSVIINFVMGLVLTLLYFFFLMWKREKYEIFILKLTNNDQREQTKHAIKQITKVSSQYLSGRLVSMFFLSAVYMIGFSIIGLPNGLFIALIAVLPTLIPYIGAFIGGLFPVLMVFIEGSTDMFWPIVLLLVLAQVFDNNIIEPLAEGERLHIGPIWTIIALVIGELIWGVAGMIIFMPLVAIIKIICDHIPTLQPYAYLLNNEIPSPKLLKYARSILQRKKKTE